MDYQEAASYWEKKDACARHMDSDSLLKEIEQFVLAHNTCALATGCREFIRCTPIEYNYARGKFWILSEGGLKFSALQENSNVCLAIYDPYTGFDKLGGLQVTGAAAMIEPWSDAYMSLLDYRKLPAESLRKLPHPLYLICITPTKFDFLWSGFKKLGYSTRQHLSLGK